MNRLGLGDSGEPQSNDKARFEGGDMSELTNFHVFWGAAIAIAEKKSASMEADGAENFARRLYDEYVEHGWAKK